MRRTPQELSELPPRGSELGPLSAESKEGGQGGAQAGWAPGLPGSMKAQKVSCVTSAVVLIRSRVQAHVPAAAAHPTARSCDAKWRSLQQLAGAGTELPLLALVWCG